MQSTDTSGDASAGPPAQLCDRCKEREGPIELRGAEHVCSACFTTYVASKSVKRLEVFQRETRSTPKDGPQRYLVALSHGPSSTALLHILYANLSRQRVRKQKARFELLVVHVESGLPATGQATNTKETSLLDLCKSRFPEIEFKSIPLSSALSLSSIDWSTLPSLDASLEPPAQLADLLNRLPSTSSRADVLRLFTRHLLIAAAIEASSHVLLLGCSTTALAELTLSETAKGRGFSLPWMINDGIFTLPRSLNPPETPVPAGETTGTAKTSIPIYFPLREVFRQELLTYIEVAAEPPLTDLLAEPLPPAGSTAGAVVSHKDLSIDEVMTRYFADVEKNYPSVVANVVRTTGKLTRAGGPDAGRCGLCGMTLDEQGDERWRGELGERATEQPGGAEGGSLCYGCQRSVHG